ncbi:MAG: M14 family metallopeptidase [Spirochaetia bacterium]
MRQQIIPVLIFALFSAALLQPAIAAGQEQIIGRSVEGRPIRAHVIGDGPVDVIIVGGIHGGYEANSIAIARRFLAHYGDDPQRLPERFTLHVIDNMNPDGLYHVTGGTPLEEFDFRAVDARSGRFNANGVDLNRNWDGDWRPQSTWRNTIVDAGSEPFSEPETQAVRDYFQEVEPAASVFYQSAGAFLWYSGAEEGWAPSLHLAEAYGRASRYRVERPDPPDPAADAEAEDKDDITGSSDDYFYRIRHRNITVELTTHYVIEWERNLAGFEALLGEL